MAKRPDVTALTKQIRVLEKPYIGFGKHIKRPKMPAAVAERIWQLCQEIDLLLGLK
jgi:hypothetical protein